MQRGNLPHFNCEIVGQDICIEGKRDIEESSKGIGEAVDQGQVKESVGSIRAGKVRHYVYNP